MHFLCKHADNFSEGWPLLDWGAQRSPWMVSCKVCGVVRREEQELLLGRRRRSHRNDNRHRQRSVSVRAEMLACTILLKLPFSKVMSCPQSCVRAWLETSINSWWSLPPLVIHWRGTHPNHLSVLNFWFLISSWGWFVFDVLGCYEGSRKGFWFCLLETCSLQDVPVLTRFVYC